MRYIGNKTKLLNIIEELINEKINIDKEIIFCDLFTGTCSVGDYFKDKYKIIANDNLYMSYCVASGKLKYNKDTFFKNLEEDPFLFFNKVDTSFYTQGYCYNNFAPEISGRMYFSDENAKLIDFIRDTIDDWYNNNKINQDEKEYLIGCLIESVSKVANVAGVYCAYLRIWDPRAIKKMKFIPLESSGKPKYNNTVYNLDSNVLISKIKGDILYLDPPYTPTQYISQYHVLETIAKNDKPVHHGKGAHRDNGDQISNWSKNGVVQKEIIDLLANSDFKYIIFSYSDAGIMSPKYLEKVFKRFAKPDTYSLYKVDYNKYKNTRALVKEIKEDTKDKKHFEWLFYIEKNNNPIYCSPLNYIGGKWNVINLIKDNLPKNINTFYDLFGGGGTVSINCEANKIIYNDINFNVTNLLKELKERNISETYKYIINNIKKYNLEKENKESYIKFRNYYNSIPVENRNPLDLYLLICFGFEHQIRFNGKMEFNNPCGNSGFNEVLLEKLVSYNYITNKKNIVFYSYDYKYFEDKIKENDFVYCDPPFLISCGAYNDGKRGFNGWDKDQERELLEFLLRLNKKKIKFMLSNMLDRNQEHNEILFDWVKENNFKIIEDSKITKRNRQNRKEILIINY
ncbi:MAG: Dam family site-specific DNA-(adenine-N6)-methyltransferase [Abditibacteriota bacterium]|nr:Dam family site-specific DNA-(adenine-N6)-methyltransferase [Abditibacteriota bacterium]